MKKLFLILIFLKMFNACAQEEQKVDSIFYLIDTIKTPFPNRMWQIEKNSSYKNYIIQCPCLNNNGMPTFFYSFTDKENFVKTIKKNELKNIKLISLTALILKSKQVLDTQMISRMFFFIEPYGKKYIIHNVALINSAIKIISSPDVIERKPDNSAFEKKGLQNADSKYLAKYFNKSIIITGKIVNRIKLIDSNINMVLLMIGADYPDQDFIIMIRGKNLDNFEPDFLIKAKTDQ